MDVFEKLNNVFTNRFAHQVWLKKKSAFVFLLQNGTLFNLYMLRNNCSMDRDGVHDVNFIKLLVCDVTGFVDK
jgi:hypothetical protein